ncbi:MAG: thioredoxin family protein [Acidobacteria bacterium]|nr:thioredoxin family protein [Acidobacteriota bacterium]
MADKRKVEIFSAGCPECEEAIKMVRSIACHSCEIEVLDMHNSDVAAKAAKYGALRLPAIAVDGKLADCCTVPGIDKSSLRAAGVGVPL